MTASFLSVWLILMLEVSTKDIDYRYTRNKELILCHTQSISIDERRIIDLKDQTQGSAQHKQTTCHWKALFAGNLIEPIAIDYVHRT